MNYSENIIKSAFLEKQKTRFNRFYIIKKIVIAKLGIWRNHCLVNFAKVLNYRIGPIIYNGIFWQNKNAIIRNKIKYLSIGDNSEMETIQKWLLQN